LALPEQRHNFPPPEIYSIIQRSVTFPVAGGDISPVPEKQVNELPAGEDCNYKDSKERQESVEYCLSFR